MIQLALPRLVSPNSLGPHYLYDLTLELYTLSPQCCSSADIRLFKILFFFLSFFFFNPHQIRWRTILFVLRLVYRETREEKLQLILVDASPSSSGSNLLS